MILSRQIRKQTAHLEHLQEQMGNLQQIVERFHRILAGAVGMFQVQAAVLLDVKTLVLNFESGASGVLCDRHRVSSAKPLVCDPGEGLGLALRDGFLAEQGLDGVRCPKPTLNAEEMK